MIQFRFICSTAILGESQDLILKMFTIDFLESPRNDLAQPDQVI